MIGAIFSRLFQPHPAVVSARENIATGVSAAFYSYDPDTDEFQAGVIVGSERIAVYGYDNEGDADAAAGALARAYGVRIRS